MTDGAPFATGGNTAAHLAQLALQAVAARSSRHVSDPRMASLRSTSHLQQLWTGSRANYRWGGRQPLRRRRGDVHGDLSAVVLRLDWDGELNARYTDMLILLAFNPCHTATALQPFTVSDLSGPPVAF